MSRIPTLPSVGFLRLPEVLALFPVSRSAWYRGIKEGRYPAPIKLGKRTAAWSVESIAALCERVATQNKPVVGGAA